MRKSGATPGLFGANGKSRPPVRDFPLGFYQREADDCAALMAALGHERYGVMGWSDGAIAAVKLAASQPEAVVKLCIFGGNSYFTQEDIDAFEATRDVEAAWSKRMKATHTPIYGAEGLQQMWGAACDGWARLYAESDGGDVCQAEAKAIACPTLVLHGHKDPICLEEHAVWFADNIPGAKLHILPEGKHNLHIRFADEVNPMVKEFMLA